MNEKAVAVINVGTSKGTLIADFLTRNDFTVYGVDRRESNPKVTRFFRMDIRNRESMELLMKIARPNVIIYCWESPDSLVADSSLLSYWKLLIHMLGSNIQNLILCMNKYIDAPFEPTSMDDFSQLTFYLLTNLFIKNYKLNATIISDKDNLLKIIKEHLILEGGGLVEK